MISVTFDVSTENGGLIFGSTHYQTYPLTYPSIPTSIMSISSPQSFKTTFALEWHQTPFPGFLDGFLRKKSLVKFTFTVHCNAMQCNAQCIVLVCLCSCVYNSILCSFVCVWMISSCSSYGRSLFLYLATSETTIASEIDAQSTSNKIKKWIQGQNHQNNLQTN